MIKLSVSLIFALDSHVSGSSKTMPEWSESSHVFGVDLSACLWHWLLTPMLQVVSQLRPYLGGQSRQDVGVCICVSFTLALDAHLSGIVRNLKSCLSDHNQIKFLLRICVSLTLLCFTAYVSCIYSKPAETTPEWSESSRLCCGSGCLWHWLLTPMFQV